MSKSCNCLDECNKISYDFDMMAEKISTKHHLNFTSTGDFALECEISIFYKDNEFVGLKRFLDFEMPVFLSNIGAFLWLFLGASILSIVEVIFFFTLRFFNNLWIDEVNAF